MGLLFMYPIIFQPYVNVYSNTKWTDIECTTTELRCCMLQRLQGLKFAIVHDRTTRCFSGQEVTLDAAHFDILPVVSKEKSVHWYL